MTFVASPVNHWHELPTNGPSVTLAALTPYLLTDGSVEFFAGGDAIPGGAVVASVVDGGGWDEIVTPVSGSERRVIEVSGHVILM
jgi:hypothetical protein